jgi:hypothetical protein
VSTQEISNPQLSASGKHTDVSCGMSFSRKDFSQADMSGSAASNPVTPARLYSDHEIETVLKIPKLHEGNSSLVNPRNESCGMSVGNGEQLEIAVVSTQASNANMNMSGSAASDPITPARLSFANETETVLEEHNLHEGNPSVVNQMDRVCGMSDGKGERLEIAVLSTEPVSGGLSSTQYSQIFSEQATQGSKTVRSDDQIGGMSDGKGERLEIAVLSTEPVSGGLSSTQCSQIFSEQATQGSKTVRSDDQIGQSKAYAMKRLKLMEELRPFQKEALATLENAKHHAIIIMPTGSGKTTLMWSYKPRDTCSLVFAPFKNLVKQLGTVLAQKGKVVSFPFVSNDGDVFSILATAEYIILPYEAAPTSADLIVALNGLNRLGPIWVDEVHNLTTTGRFRISLDSFWNLQALLQVRGLAPKMIGLTATLRPDDIPDVMRRMSISEVDVYRKSCYRAELQWRFDSPFKQELVMIHRACHLTTEFAKEGRVMVLTSTVNLCDIMAEKLQSRFTG